MTAYRLASKDDMISIYERFDLTNRMGWPVVVAERKGRIIGFLGTQDRQDMVVAGPVQVKLKVKAFVLKQLIEFYDRLMKYLGIKEYLFSVDKEKTHWIEQINEVELYHEIGDVEDKRWFKRIL